MSPRTTDTSEAGLEALIVDSLVNQAGCSQGRSENYDRDRPSRLAELQQTSHAADCRRGDGQSGRARPRTDEPLPPDEGIDELQVVEDDLSDEPAEEVAE